MQNLTADQIENFETLFFGNEEKVERILFGYFRNFERNLTENQLCQRECLILATSPKYDLAVYEIGGMFHLLIHHKDYNVVNYCDYTTKRENTVSWLTSYKELFEFFSNDNFYINVENN